MFVELYFEGKIYNDQNITVDNFYKVSATIGINDTHFILDNTELSFPMVQDLMKGNIKDVLDMVIINRQNKLDEFKKLVSSIEY